MFHSNVRLLFITVIRGLSLTCKALQYMQKDPKTQLYTCFQMSYDQVLRPYHSWVIKTLAYVSDFMYDYVLILTSILGVCLFHFIGTAPFHLDFPPSFVHLHGQTRSWLATTISVPSVGHPLRSKPLRILHSAFRRSRFR